MIVRADGRTPEQLRTVRITTGFTKNAAGSVLMCCGRTRVICTASYEEKVPAFLENKGQGWLTAEYGMLPGSTFTRKERERNKADSRSLEIQRLIGRALRAALDFEKLGPRTLKLDCDVIDADGGTRTASITGAFVAMAIAVEKLLKDGKLKENPIIRQISAVSVGIVNGVPVTDLNYVEDRDADIDMNVVMTANGEYVEIQGTGEGRPFTADENNTMLRMASIAAKELCTLQKKALSDMGIKI